MFKPGMRVTLSLGAALAVVCAMSAGPALAMPVDHRSSEQPQTDEQMTTEPGRESEVAGVRIVPSIIMKDIRLKPSPMNLRGQFRRPEAVARVYTDREGAIVGVRIQAAKLPEVMTLNPHAQHYNVYLFDRETKRYKTLGTLEAKNGGETVFGYTAKTPLTGYTALIIAPTSSIASGRPSHFGEFEGDLTALALPTTPQEMNRELRQDTEQD